TSPTSGVSILPSGTGVPPVQSFDSSTDTSALQQKPACWLWLSKCTYRARSSAGRAGRPSHSEGYSLRTSGGIRTSAMEVPRSEPPDNWSDLLIRVLAPDEGTTASTIFDGHLCSTS